MPTAKSDRWAAFRGSRPVRDCVEQALAGAFRVYGDPMAARTAPCCLVETDSVRDTPLPMGGTRRETTVAVTCWAEPESAAVGFSRENPAGERGLDRMAETVRNRLALLDTPVGPLRGYRFETVPGKGKVTVRARYALTIRERRRITKMGTVRLTLDTGHWSR